MGVSSEMPWRVSSEMPWEGSDLVRRYTAKGMSLDEKRNTFKEVLALMKKYQSKTSPKDFGYSAEMHAIIKATPPEIFSLELYGTEIFLYPMTRFQNYVELSLRELELEFDVEKKWDNFNEKTRKNICSSMYTAFEAVGEVLKLRQKISSAQLTPGDAFEKYQNKIFDCNKYCETKINYSEKLIEDELLNIVDLRKHIRRIANSSEETSKKIMQETQAFRAFVESTTFRQDATRFKTTADNHRSRAQRSIGIALLLGAIGVGWGVLLSDQDLQSSCVGYWFCLPLNIGVRGFLLAAGILVIGLYASVRSYFAHSQSEANNRQRFSALESYENIINFSSNFAISEESKKFIVQKAIECIYSHQPTGFVKEQKDSDAKTTLVVSPLSPPST